MIETAANVNRRELLKSAALGAAALASLPASGTTTNASEPESKTPRRPARGKAEACILLWLGGGAAQIDTFDPKRRGDGKKKPGSYYESLPTAIPGVSLCEHLPRLARRLERCALIRTLHHEIIDEHAAATNLVHTGRP